MPGDGVSLHVPVLRREVINWLDLRSGLTVVDGTVGGGGHSQLILTQITSSGRLIGLDRDPMMLRLAAQKAQGDHVELVQASYSELPDVLAQRSLETVDRILLDLGLSSDQLADSNRGFGFQTNAPLDLRFDPSTGVSAADLISQSSQHQLEHILTEFGEEPRAAAIAEQLIKRKPTTTAELVEAIASAGGKQTTKHPATRTFQALRIAVNEELSHLKTALSDSLPRCLAAGGRLVVITFHSLEDRLVKLSFRDDPSWQNLTKQPIPPTASEIRNNPRSRSAKLRAAERSSKPV